MNSLVASAWSVGRSVGQLETTRNFLAVQALQHLHNRDEPCIQSLMIYPPVPSQGTIYDEEGRMYYNHERLRRGIQQGFTGANEPRPGIFLLTERGRRQPIWNSEQGQMEWYDRRSGE